MSRILAIDYGTKRMGIAVTDPLKIIATGLTTLPTGKVIDFLDDYFKKESVECIVVGEPKQMNNNASLPEKAILLFITELKKKFPDMQIQRMDERFTSKIAFQSMIDSGLKKKDRRNKALIDVTSAVIILQSYMEKTKM